MMSPPTIQEAVDAEHLRLLSLLYLVSGAATSVFAVFPLIYVGMGVFIATSAHGKGAPPEFLGWLIAGIGLGVSGLAAAIATLKFLTSVNLKRRRARKLCLVTAGLTCIGIPYGTLLGVFTFIVLERPSVRPLFPEPGTASLPPVLPPPSAPTAVA
jgi:hypothetical protein